jgi:hypothetical protein
MTTPLYVDLLITNDDLTLDSGGEPLLIFDRDCIEQDIKHLIRESGLIVLCIGERDPAKRAQAQQDLQILIEDDERLIPGTVQIIEQTIEQYLIVAQTADFGMIEFIASF